MSKENYEMQFLELMKGLLAQTPDTADAPPVEVKAEAQPEPKAETSVEEMLGMREQFPDAVGGPGVPKSSVIGIPVTAITDEGVTEEAVLTSPAEEISEEERENLIWQAITADVPGLGKTVTQTTTSDLRRRLNRG